MTWLLTYGLTNVALVAPLAVAAFLVARWTRRPALAHLVWIVVLVKLVTPPLVTVPVGWEIDPQAWLANAQTLQAERPAPEPSYTTAESGPSSPTLVSAEVGRDAVPAASTAGVRPTAAKQAKSNVSQPTAPLFTLADVGRVLVWLWVAGAVLLALRIVYQAWRFQRALARFGRQDELLDHRISRVARSAGLHSWPRAVVIEGTFSPMLWGLGRGARLIFPADLRARLDIAACDALLLHELAHYSRGDHWVRLLELAAQILYWWHPVVWWARREIENAEEHCCDAWVIEHQNGTRRSYAEALLTTIDFLNEQSPALPPIASGFGEISLLRRRLTQIMCGDVTATLSPAVKLLIVAWAVVIAPLGPAVFASSSPQVVAMTRLVTEAVTPRTVATVETSQADASSAATVPTSLQTSPVLPTVEESLASIPWAPPALLGAAVSADGKYRLERRHVKGAWRITLVRTGRDGRDSLDLSSNSITKVSFSTDGRFATGHADGTVRIFDSATGGTTMTLKGGDDEITSVAFSPDRQHVAAGTAGGQALVWDVSHREEVKWPLYQLPSQIAAIGCVRWSSDGEHLAVAVGQFNASDTAELLVWSPAESVVRQRMLLSRPAAAVRFVSGDQLAVVDWGGNGDIWDLSTEDVVSSFAVDKNLVDPANWSPDCPLPISQPPAEDLVAEAR